MTSPYAPGAGVPPPVLAGRDHVRGRAVEMLARTANFGSPGRSPLVLTGVRGVGKTVTLHALAAEAAGGGFSVATTLVDRRGSLTTRLAASIAEAMVLLGPRSGSRWTRWKARMNRLSIEVSVAGVVKVARPEVATAEREQDDRQALISLIGESADLARHHDRAGLCLAVDEIQEGPQADLAALTAAAQELIHSPLVMLAAGLPTTPDRLMAAGSYAERFQYLSLGPLAPPDAAAALLVPASARNVFWDQDAAELVFQRAAGAPYLLQLYGDAAWRAGSPAPGGRITLRDAQAGASAATAELHSGLFRGRWNKASGLEQQYMTAMANLLDPAGSAGSSEIAAALGRTVSQINYVRTRLLDKGLIQSAGRGRIAFSLPGFDYFVTQEAGGSTS